MRSLSALISRKELRKRKVTKTHGEWEKELRTVRKQATTDAVEMLQLFPLWVMRNSFGFGRKRLLRFYEEYQDLIEYYNDDIVSLDDIRRTLKDETGLDIKK